MLIPVKYVRLCDVGDSKYSFNNKNETADVLKTGGASLDGLGKSVGKEWRIAH